MSKNQAIAARVLESVGGKENVKSVVHCATRLRFVLNDEKKADTQNLKADDDIIQVVQSGGQYQVVIGSHVSEVYNELTELADLDENREVAEGQKGNLFNRLVDIISSIFTPFLGAMAGAGVLKGFLALATTLGWLTTTSGVYVIFYAISDGLFMYLPVLLAFTAAKKFKTNPYLAASLAMALVHSSISTLAGEQTPISFLGIPVIIGLSGYTSSVIPIILATYVQSHVERFVKKIVPNFLQIIGVPLLVFFVMAPVTFIMIGPLGTILGDWLGSAYNGIYNFSPLIAGAVMGGLWQVFVMFGMHWGFVPIIMLNLGQNGVDSLAPMLLPAVLAQGGSALAVFFLTKNVKLKGLAMSSVITSIFGITEPTVYGVNLPLKKPFIAACIAGAIGGGFIGLSRVGNYVFGLISVLSLPGFIPQDTQDVSGMIAAAIGTAVAFVLAFLGTYLLRFDDPQEEAANSVATDDEKKEHFVLSSPLEGNIVALNQVPDQVFASGALGKGVAIEPTVGKVYAPADGVVTTLFPTGHAVGITTNEGAEILIHIGMDTVNLEGDYFKASIKQGEKVTKGDLLVSFDLEKIKAAGLSIITPVVVTNTDKFLDVIDMNQSEIIQGEDFLTVICK